MGFFSGIADFVKDTADDVFGVDDSGGLSGVANVVNAASGFVLNPTELLNDPLKAVRDNINNVGELFGKEHLTDDVVHGAGGLLGESSTTRAAREEDEARMEARANVTTPLPDLKQADVLIGSPDVDNTSTSPAQSDSLISGFSDKLKAKTTALGGLGNTKGFNI